MYKDLSCFYKFVKIDIPSRTFQRTCISRKIWQSHYLTSNKCLFRWVVYAHEVSAHFLALGFRSVPSPQSDEEVKTRGPCVVDPAFTTIWLSIILFYLRWGNYWKNLLKSDGNNSVRIVIESYTVIGISNVTVKCYMYSVITTFAVFEDNKNKGTRLLSFSYLIYHMRLFYKHRRFPFSC